MSTRYALALSVFFVWTAASAAVPQSMDYQAFLSDSTGAPIEGSISVTFAIYAVDAGGTAIWSETRSVDVQSGLFSVDLGAVTSFPAGLFDTPLWIGIAVDGDSEMIPRRALTTAAFSFQADDALSLQGQGPAELDQSGDVANLDARVLAIETDQALNSFTYNAGAERVEIDTSVGINTNNNAGLRIIETAGGGPSDNSTRIYFDKQVVAPGTVGNVGLKDDGRVYVDAGGGAEELQVLSDGRVFIPDFLGIGTTSRGGVALNVAGDAAVDVLTIRGGADIVEGFDTKSGDLVEPGSVMVIDADHPGKLRTSDTAYDGKVAGVVSGAGGIQSGLKLGQDGILDGDVPMAMSGRVYVKCSTENGPIRPGDRLTTSSLSGHAMRATDRDRADGAVIGKAMSALDEGTGLVLVLVNLQ